MSKVDSQVLAIAILFTITCALYAVLEHSGWAMATSIWFGTASIIKIKEDK